MPAKRILQLNDCTEFGLTLRARPPAIIHGVALLFTVLVGSAFVWASVTRASLVVRAAGRVRPVSVPTKIYSFGNSEVLSASTSGRAIEVHYRQGDLVHKGDVLIRMETERLETDIVKRKQAMAAADEERRKLNQTVELLDSKYKIARQKAEAELTQAEEEIRQEKRKRASDRRAAEVGLELAAVAEERARRLYARGAGSLEDLEKAGGRTREEKERLEKASLGVEQGRLKVLRRAAELVDEDFAVQKQELDMKRAGRQAERDADRVELTKLQAQLKYAELKATVDGIVTSEEVKVGDRIEPNRPVVEIAEQAGYCFEMELTSEDVGLMSVGLPVKIKLDAYDFQRYGTLDGEVVFIAPDSGTREGQPANRLPTYLARVRLTGAVVGRDEFVGQVKLGMTGQADIVTGEETLLAIFAKRIRQAFTLV